MRFVLIVLVVLAPMGLGGCASVTRGWSEQMQINSQPEGAEVRTSLNQQCVTPCTLTVQRKDGQLQVTSFHLKDDFSGFEKGLEVDIKKPADQKVKAAFDSEKSRLRS